MSPLVQDAAVRQLTTIRAEVLKIFENMPRLLAPVLGPTQLIGRLDWRTVYGGLNRDADAWSGTADELKEIRLNETTVRPS